jgi:hypothetical protein
LRAQKYEKEFNVGKIKLSRLINKAITLNPEQEMSYVYD